MKALYFAWLRERVGLSEEIIEPPVSVQTVGDLIGWLAGRGDAYAHAFEKPDVVRVALDKRHARKEAKIAGVAEVAFFPPMTGG
jgi:molybdopterin synthase sulfur carrier subunit